MTKIQYFTEIVISSVQKINDSTPSATAEATLEPGRLEDGLQRVERAGAEITEHDAESRQPQDG